MNKEKKDIPIVLAADDNYAPYAGVAVYSILQNASEDNYYRIYVFHSGIKDSYCDLLSSISGPRGAVKCVDVSSRIKDKEESLVERFYFTKETYYRFLIPELLSQYEKVIYLDCDTVVCCDIAELLLNEMDGMLIAGVKNRSVPAVAEKRKKCLSVDPNGYINAGILVFNVDLWNRENTAGKCFDLLNDFPKEELLFLDQDIINMICENRILYLEETWNYMWHMIYGNKEFVRVCSDIIERIHANYKILHFSSDLKPWNNPELPLSAEFWKFAKDTVFFEEVFQRYYQSKDEEIDRIKATVGKMEKTLKKERADRESIQKKYLNTINSKSYSLGRMISKPMRKLKKAFKF